MAFPKKKSRTIIVNRKEYAWICVQNFTLNTPVDVEPNHLGELPPLDKNIDWCYYDDVYGYNSKTTLRILDAPSKIKVTFEFNGSDYFASQLKVKDVGYLSITPAVVKQCIDYLNTEKQWINNLTIRGETTYKLFQSILKNS